MDLTKLKIVELRSQLNELGLDKKGNKKVLVTRLKNVLNDSFFLDTSMEKGEETSKRTSQATELSPYRQISSLIPLQHLSDAIKEEPEDISEVLEANSYEQQQIALEPIRNNKENNWYNAYDKLNQSSIDIKEEILLKESIEEVHESETSEYQDKRKTTIPLYSHITPEHKIVLLRKEGLSVAAIARKTGVARNTVYLWIRRWENKGNVKEIKKPGTPRRTRSTKDIVLGCDLCHPKENPSKDDAKTTRKLKTLMTAQKRHEIVLLRKEGLSIAAIARKVGVARNTVYLWIKRWENKSNIKEVKKSGRPRKTSSTQDIDIIKRIKENPFVHTKNIASTLNISYNIVRRRIREAGEHHRIKARRKCKDDKTKRKLKTPMTLQERHKIVLLRKEGLPIADIARKIGVARNTVYLWIRRWESKGDVNEIKRSGRPRKTSITQDIDIKQRLKEDPFIKPKNIASSLNISYNTIRRRLREAGEHHRKTARRKKCKDDAKTTRQLKTPMTAQERHKIVLLREEGLSIAAIARKIGAARNTVYLWIRRWENKGDVNEVKKSGRPRKTSSTQDIDIIQRLKENPFIKTKNIATSQNISYNL